MDCVLYVINQDINHKNAPWANIKGAVKRNPKVGEARRDLRTVVTFEPPHKKVTMTERKKKSQTEMTKIHITNIMAMMKQLSPEEHINMLSELNETDF